MVGTKSPNNIWLGYFYLEFFFRIAMKVVTTFLKRLNFTDFDKYRDLA